MNDEDLFKEYFAGAIDLNSLMSGYLDNHPGATLVVFMIALEDAYDKRGA